MRRIGSLAGALGVLIASGPAASARAGAAAATEGAPAPTDPAGATPEPAPAAPSPPEASQPSPAADSPDSSPPPADSPEPGAFTMPISGRLFADGYVPLQEPWDRPYVQLSTSAWFRVDPSWKQVGARLLGTADTIYRSSAGAGPYRVRLREGYLYARGTGWEVKAGQLLIPWGVSDGINPTDFLTAKDFTFFNPDEEVRRQGGAGASVTWTPADGSSPVTLTGVFMALPARSTLLLPPGLLPSSVVYADSSPTVRQRASALGLDDTAAALMVAYAGSGWDASLIGYRGWSSLPELAYAGFNPTTGLVTLRPVYHRISAAGANGSTSIGSWVLRGEAAYVVTENDDGQNPLIQPSHLLAVAGAERPLGEAFRVGVQGIWRWNPRLTSPQNAPYSDAYAQMANPLIAGANAILFGYQAHSQVTVTLRAGYTDDTHLVAVDLFAIYNFYGRDSLIRFKVSHGLTPALKLTLGLDRYAGPLDSPFGAMKPFSAAFAEGKFTF